MYEEWTCPECKQLCNSITEHVCLPHFQTIRVNDSASNRINDQRISLTEKGLAELRKKRKYTKRSPYWKTTLKQRISAAIKAFKRGR